MSTKQLLRDVISAQIEDVIAGSGILGEYIYEVSFDMVQPTQEGLAVTPNLQIMIAEKHPTDIGGYLTTMTTVPGPFPAPGHIDAAVLALINALGEQRKAAVGEASGLIMP